MARNDPFTTAAFDVANSGTFVVDGSGSSTGAAIVSGIGGNADASIELQAYDGSAWVRVAELSDASGNTPFTADWHTQFNRVLVNGGGSPTSGDQRLEVTNVSGGLGDFSADGDER